MQPKIVGDPGMHRLADDIARLLGGRFVGLYLEGSFAWGAELPTSDVDLRVVVDGLLEAEVKEKLEAIARQAAVEIGHAVDLQTDSFGDLMRIGTVRFQHTIPLAGRDVRSLVPLKPIEAFARDAVASARWLASSLRTLYGRPAEFPLRLPNPNLEFRGYEVQGILVGSATRPSTKRLVTNVLAVATALIAARGGYVLNKHQVASLYRQTVADDWSSFVAEVYVDYRVKLGYELPVELPERRKLTQVCERATDFENRLMLLS